MIQRNNVIVLVFQTFDHLIPIHLRSRLGIEVIEMSNTMLLIIPTALLKNLIMFQQTIQE